MRKKFWSKKIAAAFLAGSLAVTLMPATFVNAEEAQGFMPGSYKEDHTPECDNFTDSAIKIEFQKGEEEKTYAVYSYKCTYKSLNGVACKEDHLYETEPMEYTEECLNNGNIVYSSQVSEDQLCSYEDPVKTHEADCNDFSESAQTLEFVTDADGTEKAVYEYGCTYLSVAGNACDITDADHIYKTEALSYTEESADNGDTVYTSTDESGQTYFYIDTSVNAHQPECNDFTKSAESIEIVKDAQGNEKIVYTYPCTYVSKKGKTCTLDHKYVTVPMTFDAVKAEDRSITYTSTDSHGQTYFYVKAAEPIKITEDMVKLSSTTFEYNGTTQKPEVTVVSGEDTLRAGKDYEIVSNIGRKVAGTGTVTIKGLEAGNCSGTVTVNYAVKPKSSVNLTLGSKMSVSSITGTTTSKLKVSSTYKKYLYIYKNTKIVTKKYNPAKIKKALYVKVTLKDGTSYKTKVNLKIPAPSGVKITKKSSKLASGTAGFKYAFSYNIKCFSKYAPTKIVVRIKEASGYEKEEAINKVLDQAVSKAKSSSTSYIRLSKAIVKEIKNASGTLTFQITAYYGSNKSETLEICK